MLSSKIFQYFSSANSKDMISLAWDEDLNAISAPRKFFGGIEVHQGRARSEGRRVRGPGAELPGSRTSFQTFFTLNENLQYLGKKFQIW